MDDIEIALITDLWTKNQKYILESKYAEKTTIKKCIKNGQYTAKRDFTQMTKFYTF